MTQHGSADVANGTSVPDTCKVSNVAGSMLAPGTTVAGYRIEALIGRGGMGAVYRAQEEGLGRKVALKVIAPELAQDERFRERFLRESRIAASLDHPHVIPIYQAGDEDGLLFLAMRYVEGSDLAKVVAEDGALEPKRAVDLLSQIAEALDAAHEKGLVHRDVKPSNVLIAESAGTRALLPRRLRAHEAHGLPLAASRSRARSWARSSTSRPSRSPATRSTSAPTCTRSAASSTSA